MLSLPSWVTVILRLNPFQLATFSDHTRTPLHIGVACLMHFLCYLNTMVQECPQQQITCILAYSPAGNMKSYPFMDKNVHFLQALFDTCHFRNKAWYVLKLVLKELYIFASDVFKIVELCCLCFAVYSCQISKF